MLMREVPEKMFRLELEHLFHRIRLSRKENGTSDDIPELIERQSFSFIFVLDTLRDPDVVTVRRINEET